VPPDALARDIGIGLFDPCVFRARQGEVRHDVQAVTATRGPTGHDADDDLRHEANEPLCFQDVQAADR